MLQLVVTVTVSRLFVNKQEWVCQLKFAGYIFKHKRECHELAVTVTVSRLFVNKQEWVCQLKFAGESFWRLQFQE
jgi:hypothetical protein